MPKVTEQICALAGQHILFPAKNLHGKKSVGRRDPGDAGPRITGRQVKQAREAVRRPGQLLRPRRGRGQRPRVQHSTRRQVQKCCPGEQPCQAEWAQLRGTQPRSPADLHWALCAAPPPRTRAPSTETARQEQPGGLQVRLPWQGLYRNSTFLSITSLRTTRGQQETSLKLLIKQSRQ